MKNFKFIFLIVILAVNFSCTKEQKKISVVSEKNLESQVVEAYQEGMKALEDGDVLYAAKKFNEAEILFPQSDWAPNSALMAAYSYYLQDYYGDVIAELERFLVVYKKNKNIDYANYLLAITYYEQIVDEKRDLNSILNAKKYFNVVIKLSPNSEYAVDAKFKLDLINDILASKEMYIGRYYVERKKWIPAINRFRSVVDEYETTIYTQEAIHRLVEIYYILGLTGEAKKYAKLLGYNYQSSEWYEKSYSLFDKMYEKNKKIIKQEKKKDNILIRKIKSLFD